MRNNLSKYTVQGLDPEAAFITKEPVNHIHPELVDKAVHLESYRVVFEKLPDQKVIIKIGDNSVLISIHQLHNALNAML